MSSSRDSCSLTIQRGPPRKYATTETNINIDRVVCPYLYNWPHDCFNCYGSNPASYPEISLDITVLVCNLVVLSIALVTHSDVPALI